MLFSRLTFAIFVISTCSSLVTAQTDAPSRSITAEDFQSKRPQAKSAAGSPQKRPTESAGAPKRSTEILSSTRRKYSFVSRVSAVRATQPVAVSGHPAIATAQPAAKTAAKTVAPKLKDEELGVTFWRLRPVADTDGDIPTFPVRVGQTTQKWAAERVKSSTRFKTGDRVRFTIEASRSGYLYIANREVYTDGSTGEAEIIFPTLRTRGGDNHVSVGTLVDIPASTDSVPYFTVQPRRPDYAGEELIVVITPNEMPDIEKALRPLPISRDRLEKWYEWQMGADVYDADEGEGIAYTRSEAEATESTSRSLTREEPLPQTIYRLKIAKETPLFVIIRMEPAK